MIGIFIFLVLLAIGFFFGRINEAAHFRSLVVREQALAHIKLSTTRQIPDHISHSRFIAGNVVISIDYFKRIAAGVRTIFGGRINSYATLVERARREAVVRLKQQADEIGASMIANVRIETSSVFQNTHNQIGSLEVYAYGTALK